MEDQRQMRASLLRVGIDSGAGGIQGPLFEDDSFEFIPIPHADKDIVEERTYGNTKGEHGKNFIEYFPRSCHPRSLYVTRRDQPIHFDPDFKDFTYGCLLRTNQARLRDLTKGDMLIFYCGLQTWVPWCGFQGPDALYLIGYFEVEVAGKAIDFERDDPRFAKNAHVRNQSLYKKEKDRLVLVKGSSDSRLLTKAKLLSEDGKNSAGKRLKVLSAEMKKYFGDLGGKNSLQRSAPRWIHLNYVEQAAKYMRGLK